jgi:hypothetical protein
MVACRWVHRAGGGISEAGLFQSLQAGRPELNTKKDKEIRLWAARVWPSRDAVRAIVGSGDAFLLLEIGQGVGDGLFTALVSFEVERFQELATA